VNQALGNFDGVHQAYEINATTSFDQQGLQSSSSRIAMARRGVVRRG